MSQSARFAFLLQREDAFYAQFGADLAAATLALTQFRARPVVDFAPDLSAGVVAERLLRLGEYAHAVAIVSVDHPRVSDAIATLKARGVPTFAILTELGAEAGALMSDVIIARKDARRPGSSPRPRGGPARSASSSAATGFSARRRRKSRSGPICGRTRPNSRRSSRWSISRTRASPMRRRRT